MESLSKLVSLTDLDGSEMYDNSTDLQMVRLASSLPKLEVGSINGDELHDDIWDAVASLRSLRRLEFSAVTHFTADGIFDFIGKLGIGNKGLVLEVMNSKSKLLWVEQGLIRGKITAKVGEISHNRGNYY